MSYWIKQLSLVNHIQTYLTQGLSGALWSILLYMSEEFQEVPLSSSTRYMMADAPSGDRWSMERGGIPYRPLQKYINYQIIIRKKCFERIRWESIHYICSFFLKINAALRFRWFLPEVKRGKLSLKTLLQKHWLSECFPSKNCKINVFKNFQAIKNNYTTDRKTKCTRINIYISSNFPWHINDYLENQN